MLAMHRNREQVATRAAIGVEGPRRLTPVSIDSDHAELSTLHAQLDDLMERVIDVASRYEDSIDSAVADDLFATERALLAARRSLERASARLAG
jgi:hypothetical protein